MFNRLPDTLKDFVLVAVGAWFVLTLILGSL